MKLLGIESTCDETAASVVDGGTRVLSNVIASQAELHAKYRGVVPEIASRAHIENITPVIREALATAGCGWDDIDAIAIAYRPGLIGSLLIGVTAAKTLAWMTGKPLVGVDHVHAHLYSVDLAALRPVIEQQPLSPCTRGEGSGEGLRRSDAASKQDLPPPSPLVPKGRGIEGEGPTLATTFRQPSPSVFEEPLSLTPSPLSTGKREAIYSEELNTAFPALGFVASGGHTALYAIRSWTDISLIGATIDDAVGEAYDKVAAILGLGYPGGPILDQLATRGDPAAIPFPRPTLGRESLDFSFSGLKTAVLYAVRGVPGKSDPVPPLTEMRIADVAASFQQASIDVIVKKLKRGLQRTGAQSILIGGGVSANRGLRAALQTFDVPVLFPQREYCTDNAAMIAGLGHVLLAAGQTSKLDLDAVTFSQFVRS